MEKNITRKPKKLWNILLCESSREDSDMRLVLCLDFLSLLIGFCFCFRPVNQPASIFLAGGTQIRWGIVFRLEFRQHTRRKIGLFPIVTSLWKKKIYSNVVIGCNVAMLSSPSFSTACRAHKLTRKLSRDSEQLYSSI